MAKQLLHDSGAASYCYKPLLRHPLSTWVYGALPGTGSSPIHRRGVNFIGPGRGRMGRTDRGLLRRIVLREALAARLAESCSIGRGYAAQLWRIPLPRTPVKKPTTHLAAYYLYTQMLRCGA